MPEVDFWHFFMSDAEQICKLASVLVNATMWTIAGALAPNVVTAPARPHNALKLTNECLARHQLATLNFFVIACLVVENRSNFLLSFLSGFIAITLVFYFAALNRTKDPGEKLKICGHECEWSERCSRPISRSQGIRFLSINAVLVFLSLLMASAIILWNWNAAPPPKTPNRPMIDLPTQPHGGTTVPQSP